MASSTKSAPKPRRDWRPAFLEDLRSHGIISHAAKVSAIDRQTAYNEYHRNKEFASQWDDAVEAATDTLEKEAIRRARDGTDEPVYYQGEKVGTVKRYSDALLMFLLRANRSKFRNDAKPEDNDRAKADPDAARAALDAAAKAAKGDG